MSFNGVEKRWICSRGSMTNLHRVTSIVREIREISKDPCLNRSPNKGSKCLKPEMWQSIFDDDGKAFGFRKALKLIIEGGVDPSIRLEVWEFLLGCYSLSSTAEYRKRLRMARRERYEDLIRECQGMNSTVGTGTLAYVVGSKVMDMRTLSTDQGLRETETTATPGADINNKVKKEACSYAHYDDTSAYFNSAECFEACADRDPSNDTSSDMCNCFTAESSMDVDESLFSSDSYFDFPPLPVTDLFQKSSPDEKRCRVHGRQSSSEYTSERATHRIQNSDNTDLITESGDLSSSKILHTTNVQAETFDSGIKENIKERVYKSEGDNTLRVSDVPREATGRLIRREDRVSEWLWILHRIVVDVVRTDNHLEFYGDSRNMARMSDILAVYAWIDPATGYCQGMSDLLSPFVVLYEDNADAFWCFEMLLRRLRDNFQMEGPTGIMKQLEELWKILEHTDAEVYAHLSLIGADLLFAFRMLLVLFRRELSFNEALCMWEMMWAADFDEALTRDLEDNCLEPLVLQFPKDSDVEIIANMSGDNKIDVKTVTLKHSNVEVDACDGNGVKSDSRYPFCGLTKANFWAKHQDMHMTTFCPPARSKDDELSVFCVAAILITNRHKIMRKARSNDDILKMFNDNLLKINVKRCVSLAIKLRKKYFHKINVETSEQGISTVMPMLSWHFFHNGGLALIKQLSRRSSTVIPSCHFSQNANKVKDSIKSNTMTSEWLKTRGRFSRCLDNRHHQRMLFLT